MKVGKPKSKRVPVRLRHKIEKASAAKQRKQRKEAKKNPQWRSRLKKDPGIPNLFPYKAQVLAEIEENKRKKEEEAQRKREVAKAQRQGKAVDLSHWNGLPKDMDQDDEVEVPSDNMDDAEEDDSMDDQDTSNPMAALLTSAQARADAYPVEEDTSADEDDDDEWDGIDDTNPAVQFSQLQKTSLPKQAIADPIKTVSRLLARVQEASGGVQLLLDFYELAPLVTAGSDLNSRFLVEVARKRGRLGKGGVPNLHSAALTVLSDLNEERLVLPPMKTKSVAITGKGDVKIVEKLAEPFRIEGLWGDDDVEHEDLRGQEMAIEASA